MVDQLGRNTARKSASCVEPTVAFRIYEAWPTYCVPTSTERLQGSSDLLSQRDCGLSSQCTKPCDPWSRHLWSWRCRGTQRIPDIVVHTVILGIIRPPGVPLKVGGLCSLEVTQSQASSLVTEGENPSQAASRVWATLFECCTQGSPHESVDIG